MEPFHEMLLKCHIMALMASHSHLGVAVKGDSKQYTTTPHVQDIAPNQHTAKPNEAVFGFFLKKSDT
jgi:hypothetical protein